VTAVIYIFDDDYALDPQRYELRYMGKLVKLEPQVFNVLLYLIRQRERVVTKEELLAQLWPGRIVSEATLTSRVKAARQAIGDRGRQQRLIQTLHGRGYRFIASVEERPEDNPAAVDPSPTSRIALLTAPAVRSATAEPVTVWSPPGTGRRSPEAAFEGPQDDAFPLLSTPPAALRAVGRGAELAQLHRWLQHALGGTRQVVFVTGEAGLGKTTLLEAFLQGMSGYSVLWIGHGQCLEHYGAGEAYLPVLEALGRMCREPDGQALLALLLRRAPTWAVQMPWLLDDAALETLQRRVIGVTRERMLREMAESIEVLTAERPPVLILEDLHWSDASTLDLIALLARRREPARLLLLGTYRPAEAILHSHLGAGRGSVQAYATSCPSSSLRL